MENDGWLWLTTLAAFVAFLFKAWQFYRDRRPHLRIVPSFTPYPATGNTIVILNSSKVGTTIHYYMLEGLVPTWLNRRWPRFSSLPNLVEFDPMFGGGDRVNIDVPAYGQAVLRFTGSYHFDWDEARTTDLYLRLWTTARRKPMNYLIVRAGRGNALREG